VPHEPGMTAPPGTVGPAGAAGLAGAAGPSRCGRPSPVPVLAPEHFLPRVHNLDERD
jgi:hypothetical protein